MQSNKWNNVGEAAYHEETYHDAGILAVRKALSRIYMTRPNQQICGKLTVTFLRCRWYRTAACGGGNLVGCKY